MSARRLMSVITDLEQAVLHTNFWKRYSIQKLHRIHFSYGLGHSMGESGYAIYMCRPPCWSDIKVGDCIRFRRGTDQRYHRVTRIEDVDGERRYFTKGDTVSNEDHGYATINDIFGVGLINFFGFGFGILRLPNAEGE